MMRTFTTTSTMKVMAMVILAGGLLLGGMTGQALAGDKKFYDASLCQPEDGDKAGKFARYGGKIWNYDKVKTLRVDCAVIRDNTENRNGLKSWGLAGRNSNSDSLLICRMKSIDSRSAKVLFSGFVPMFYSRSLETRGVNLVWREKGRQTTLSKGLSYYVISCEIPPWKGQASHIASYYIEEY